MLMILQHFSDTEMIRLNLVSRHFYMIHIPLAMHSFRLNELQRHVQTLLLQAPNVAPPKILKLWRANKPLTVKDFEETARKFRIPPPKFDSKKTCLMTKTEKLRIIQGQFDLKSGE